MSDPYIGEIRMFGGNFAPLNWALCNGQPMSIAEYDALYSLLGTTYGGDGVNTFNLPDLRGRIPVHQGTNIGTTFVIGQVTGTESVTLTMGQLPSHTHTANCNGTATGSQSPANAIWAAYDQNQYTDQATPNQMNAGALRTAGGNQPHENRMPFLTINFIISLSGIYPVRG